MTPRNTRPKAPAEIARLIAIRARLTAPGADVPDPDPDLPPDEQLRRTIELAKHIHGADAIAHWLRFYENDRRIVMTEGKLERTPGSAAPTGVLAATCVVPVDRHPMTRDQRLREVEGLASVVDELESPDCTIERVAVVIARSGGAWEFLSTDPDLANSLAVSSE